MSNREMFEEHERQALAATKQRVSDWIDSSMNVIKMHEKSDGELPISDTAWLFPQKRSTPSEENQKRGYRNKQEEETGSLELDPMKIQSAFTNRMKAFKHDTTDSPNNNAEGSVSKNELQDQELTKIVDSKMKDRCIKMLNKAEEYYEQKNVSLTWDSIVDICAGQTATRVSKENPYKNTTEVDLKYSSKKALNDSDNNEIPESASQTKSPSAAQKANSLIREIFPPQFEAERSSTSEASSIDDSRAPFDIIIEGALEESDSEGQTASVRKIYACTTFDTTDTSSMASGNSAYFSVKSLRHKKPLLKTQKQGQNSRSKKLTCQTQETTNEKQVCDKTDVKTTQESSEIRGTMNEFKKNSETSRGDKYSISNRQKCISLEPKKKCKPSDGTNNTAITKLVNERSITGNGETAHKDADSTAKQVHIKREKQSAETRKERSCHTEKLSTTKRNDVTTIVDDGKLVSQSRKQRNDTDFKEDKNRTACRRNGTGDHQTGDVDKNPKANRVERKSAKRNEDPAIEDGESTSGNLLTGIGDNRTGKKSEKERSKTGENTRHPSCEKENVVTENLSTLSNMCKQLVGKVSNALIAKEVKDDTKNHGKRTDKTGDGQQPDKLCRQREDVEFHKSKASTVNVVDTGKSHRQPIAHTASTNDQNSKMETLTRKEIAPKQNYGDTEIGPTNRRDEKSTHNKLLSSKCVDRNINKKDDVTREDKSKDNYKCPVSKSVHNTGTANTGTGEEMSTKVKCPASKQVHTVERKIKSTDKEIRTNNLKKTNKKHIGLLKCTTTKDQSNIAEISAINLKTSILKHVDSETMTKDNAVHEETSTSNYKQTTLKLVGCKAETRDQGCGEASIASYTKLSARNVHYTKEHNGRDEKLGFYSEPSLIMQGDNNTEYFSCASTKTGATSTNTKLEKSIDSNVLDEVIYKTAPTKCRPTSDKNPESATNNYSAPLTTNHRAETSETTAEKNAATERESENDFEETKHFNSPTRGPSPEKRVAVDNPRTVSIVNIVFADGNKPDRHRDGNKTALPGAGGKLKSQTGTTPGGSATGQARSRFKTTMSQKGTATPQTSSDVDFTRWERLSKPSSHSTNLTAARETGTGFEYKLIPEKMQQKILNAKSSDRTAQLNAERLSKRQDLPNNGTPTAISKARSQYETIQNTIGLLSENYAPVRHTLGTNTGVEQPSILKSTRQMKDGGTGAEFEKTGNTGEGLPRQNATLAKSNAEVSKSVNVGGNPKVTFKSPERQIDKGASVVNEGTQKFNFRRGDGSFNVNDSYTNQNEGAGNKDARLLTNVRDKTAESLRNAGETKRTEDSPSICSAKQATRSEGNGHGDSNLKRPDSTSSHSRVGSTKPKISIRPYYSRTVLDQNPYLMNPTASYPSNPSYPSNKSEASQRPRDYAPTMAGNPFARDADPVNLRRDLPSKKRNGGGGLACGIDDVTIDIRSSDSCTDIRIKYSEDSRTGNSAGDVGRPGNAGQSKLDSGKRDVLKRLHVGDVS